MQGRIFSNHRRLKCKCFRWSCWINLKLLIIPCDHEYDLVVNNELFKQNLLLGECTNAELFQVQSIYLMKDTKSWPSHDDRLLLEINRHHFLLVLHTGASNFRLRNPKRLLDCYLWVSNKYNGCKNPHNFWMTPNKEYKNSINHFVKKPRFYKTIRNRTVSCGRRTPEAN